MKSRMKIDFFPMVEALFLDATTKCDAAPVETRRDLSKIKRRIKDEGISFLTITLPNFGKLFEKALSIRLVRQQDFLGWKFSAGLPELLRGFLCVIFDSKGGQLLDEPNIQAIEAVRQICLSFKKLGLECTKQRTYKAVEGYVKTERTLRSAVLPVSSLELYSSVANLLWGNMFHDFNTMECIPKHGPGAVVQGYSPNEKWTLNDWPQRVEADFPYDWFACLNASEIADHSLNHNVVPEGAQRAMRMALVPKTLKTPRIIAISLCEMQYLQQGIKDYLVKVLENSEITKGHINFTDQTVNQKLAMSSSRDGNLATLDMSEASDRILLSLVRSTFNSCPNLLNGLLCTREDEVQLPFLVRINKDVAIRKLRLKKFAGMGSATCFPVEAMVFFTIIVTALLDLRSLRPTLRNIYNVSRSVYVYGDDIIVPVNEASGVMEWLERFHCRVNHDKSFTTGNFRESCGMDAFSGVDVTPTYIRTIWPSCTRNSSEIQSLVATGNQFYERGYIRSAMYIRNRIEQVVGPLPCCQNETFAGLSWSWRDGLESLRVRFNRKIQTKEVLSLVSSPSRFDDPIDDYRALLKTLSSAERGSFDGKDLGRSTLYTIKRFSDRTVVIPKTTGKNSVAPDFRPIPKRTLFRDSLAVATEIRWVLRKIAPQRSERHGASTLKRRWVASTV